MNQFVYNEVIKSYDLHTIYQYVENKYKRTTLDSLKEFIKISKRIEKCMNDIFFNTSCLQHNVLPNYTRFKTTNNRLKLQSIYRVCRKLLLTTELSNHKSDLKKLNKKQRELLNGPLFEIPQQDFNSIEFVISKFILNVHARQSREKIIKKLNNLNVMLNTNEISVNSQFVNMRRNNIDHEILLPTFKPVFDLSDSLENDEIELLGKGLKYGIKKRNFNKFEILTRFEEFAHNLDKETIAEIDSDIYATTAKESFLTKLSNLTYEFIESAVTPINSLTFDEEQTLIKLKTKVKDKDLIVSKSDKGNATVVTKKVDYIAKMEEILSDKTKFELIENQSENIIQQMERSFNSYLYSIKDEYKKVVVHDELGKTSTEKVLHKTKSINQQIYKQIFSTGKF